MKIIIIGATGTIGKHVVKALEEQHEIVKVGSKSGDKQVDITDVDSIKRLFESVGSFDALVSASGGGQFSPLSKTTDKEFRVAINSKLMGQVNLVLVGQHYVNKGGSFTLTSGSMAKDPIVAGASVSTVNGALNSFVRAAAIELENGVRINSVSPTVVEESPGYFPFFPGSVPVSMHRVAQAYVKSVLGKQTGEVYWVE